MGNKKQQGLVRVRELMLNELPGFEQICSVKPGAGIKAETVQSKNHFTRNKQVGALVGIGEDPNADMGFMARMLTLCSLPRTDPGGRLQYKRQNGPYKLIMIAGGDNRLPYGNLPRLLLAWVSTEAVRTQERELILGNSLSSFMRQLGMYSDSGGSRGDRTRLKQQIDRLFNSHVQLIYETQGHKATASSAVADQTDLWWDYKKPQQDTLWQSRIRLGEAFFNEIIAHPVPLDMRILKEMRRSSLGLDLYMWLSYKTFSLYSQGKKPERLPWERLFMQFGADPTKTDDKYVIRDFRKDVLRELKKLKLCWTALSFATPTGCLEIRACAPSILPKAINH
ncbi:MAG: replication protein RepA [Bryobacteraceae bacterium]